MLKFEVLVAGISLLLIQPPNPAPQKNVAQLLMEKGLARINNNLRENITADMVSITEEYGNKDDLEQGRNPRHKKTTNSRITGRPNLDKLNINDLYKALATRYEFYIDDAHSTDVVNGIMCALIHFRPKPGLSVRETADQFINRVNGNVYINLDNFQIIKIEGSAKDHFGFTYWLLGLVPISVDVYEFSFSVEYTEFNGVVIEKYLFGLADYQIRKRGVETHAYELSNYRIK